MPKPASHMGFQRNVPSPCKYESPSTTSKLEPVICVQYGATVQEQYQAKETTLGNGALKRYVEKDLEDMESHVEQPYTWFTSNEERKVAALERYIQSCDHEPLTVSFIGGQITHGSASGTETGLSYPRYE
eukprot:gene27687-7328_t